MPRGGSREGAGRPRKEPESTPATAIAAALLEMAIGQSNVRLELDSQGRVKPNVQVFHADPKRAGQLAQTEFDRLMDVYHPRARASVPTSMDAFTTEDLALLGLKRIEEA